VQRRLAQLQFLYMQSVLRQHQVTAAYLQARLKIWNMVLSVKISHKANIRMITVTGLFVYPVKSLQGIALDKAVLTGPGLQYDRTWMVTDQHGDFLSQRDLPAMATIRVSLTHEVLRLQHDAAGVLEIPLRRSLMGSDLNMVEGSGGVDGGVWQGTGGRPTMNVSAQDLRGQNPVDSSSGVGQIIDVTVWGDSCRATDEGSEASRWLTGILGEVDGAPVRLVRFAEGSIRPVESDSDGLITSVTAFADGYPFLVASEESLSELNRRLVENGAEPVTMDRFRANIVIRGGGAFAEDRMEVLQDSSGRYVLGIRKPCKRCKVTTVNQQTGEIPDVKEPLRTLAAMNPFPDQTGAFFGQNAILLGGNGSTIRVGDSLSASFKQ